MSPEVLGDEMIELTPFGPADAEAHLAGEDGEIVRWLSGGRSTPQSLRAYLDNCVRWRAAGGPLLAYGIRVRPTCVLAGTLDLWFRQPYLHPDEVNVAYALYPMWRGRGLATRAVLAGCRYLSLLPSVHTAVIRVDPRNLASAAVAHRAGFRYQQRTADEQGCLDWYRRPVPAAPPG